MDSHENLPKGKTKEEEDIAFLRVHWLCSCLSRADFIHRLAKARAGCPGAGHGRAVPEATDLRFLLLMDTGDDLGFQTRTRTLSVVARGSAGWRRSRGSSHN